MSLASKILTPAAQQLQDISGVKWTSDGLLNYLNLAINEIINLKPDAYTNTQLLQLIAGVRQPLGAMIDLIDITCNMGASGTVRGNSITSIPKEKMDELLPGWPTFPAASGVIYAVVDERDPKNLFVFPPQQSPLQKIEILATSLPTVLTAAGDTFPLDDGYIPPCIDYVIGRSLMEETSLPNAQAKGQWFMQRFMQGLGLRVNVENKNEAKGE